jgi:hypothetical protein
MIPGSGNGHNRLERGGKMTGLDRKTAELDET